MKCLMKVVFKQDEMFSVGLEAKACAEASHIILDQLIAKIFVILGWIGKW